jgi:hypothetical protein
MEMFLMVLAMSLLGVVVSGVLFSAAAREGAREPSVALRAPSPALAASRFFVDVAAPPPVPIEALLLQIEQHVRLEQAAAEAFLHAPTRQSLHCRTMSPLVH